MQPKSTSANPGSGPSQLSLFDEVPEVAEVLPFAPAKPATPTTTVAPATNPTRPTPAAKAELAQGAVLASLVETNLVETSPGVTVLTAQNDPAQPRSRRDVLLAGHRVAYELRRSRRRSIGIVVGPEGLAVSAPRWVGQAEIEAALREKAAWVLRKLQEQRERGARLEAARVQWSEGGSIPFLGETVIMVLDPRATGAELHTDAQALPGVPKLTLHLGLPQTASTDQFRELVQSWLQRQAKRIFEERCQVFAQRLGVRVTSMSLSSANTRWGSARADGGIRLNWRLVHFGLPVIDYVVAHELAHLREMNHSPAFWDVVRAALPEYEAARGELRREILPQLE